MTQIHVHGVLLRNFMNHKRTTVRLPRVGLVLVTGLNGSGKSALPESVAYAISGRSLRGDRTYSPWTDGIAGDVTLDFNEGCLLRRSISAKGKKSVEYAEADPGLKGAQHWKAADTNTKTQGVVDSWTDDFDLWRRTHVFSSADAAHFSSATDKERKQMIEAMLGLSVFDTAHEKALAEVRSIDAELQQLRLDKTRVESRVEGLQSGLDAFIAQGPPAKPRTPEPEAEPARPDEARADALVAAYKQIQVDHAAALKAGETSPEEREFLASLQTRVAQAQSECFTARRALELVRKGKCGECERPYESMSVALAEGVVEASGAAYAEVQSALTYATNKGIEFQRTMSLRRETLEKTAADVRAELDDFRVAKQRHQEWNTRRASLELEARVQDEAYASACKLWQDRRDKMLFEVRDLRSQLLDLADTLEATEWRASVAAAAEKVLGFKGVRAHVLGKALVGVQAVANAWLARFAPGVTVSISSYTEKKTGGVSDSISLTITGAGGGRGYQGASGGERRRIDAAILLALAEVASASAKSGALGTLWMDEVFDAIDVEGAPLVVDALEELAKTRCVVLITHREDITRNARAVMRLHAEAGVYSER